MKSNKKKYVTSFRADRKKIEAASRRLGSKNMSDTLRDALDHALVCQMLNEDQVIFFSVSHVAKILKKSDRQVYRYIEDGIIETYPGTNIILLSSLIDYLKRFNDEISIELIEQMSQMSTEFKGYITPKKALKKFQSYGLKKGKLYYMLRNNKVDRIMIGEGRYLVNEKSLRRKLQFRPKVYRYNEE